MKGNTPLNENGIFSGNVSNISRDNKKNNKDISEQVISDLNENIEEILDYKEKNSLIFNDYMQINGLKGKDLNTKLDKDNNKEFHMNVYPNENLNDKIAYNGVQNNQSAKNEISFNNNITDFYKKKFKKGKWNKEEDQKLINLIEKYSFNWKIIKSKFRHRTLTQIKQRFMNNLNPNINRSKFTEEEDRKLDLYYSVYGTNWKKISSFFDFRPPNFIKNRFYTKNRTLFRKNRDNTSNKNEGSNIDNILEERKKNKIFDTIKLEKAKTGKPIIAKNITENTLEESNMDNFSEIFGTKNFSNSNFKREINDNSHIHDSFQSEKKRKFWTTVKSEEDNNNYSIDNNLKNNLNLNNDNKTQEYFSAPNYIDTKFLKNDNSNCNSGFTGENLVREINNTTNNIEFSLDKKNNKMIKGCFNFNGENKQIKKDLNSNLMGKKDTTESGFYSINHQNTDFLIRNSLIKLSKNSINLQNLNKDISEINNSENKNDGFLKNKRKRKLKKLETLENKPRFRPEKIKKYSFINYIKNFTIYNNNSIANPIVPQEEMNLHNTKKQFIDVNNSNSDSRMNSTGKAEKREKADSHFKNENRRFLHNNSNFAFLNDGKKDKLDNTVEETYKSISDFQAIYRESSENLKKIKTFQNNSNNNFNLNDNYQWFDILMEFASFNFNNERDNNNNNFIYKNEWLMNKNIIYNNNNNLFIQSLVNNKNYFARVIEELEEKSTEFSNDLVSCVINNIE